MKNRFSHFGKWLRRITVCLLLAEALASPGHAQIITEARERHLPNLPTFDRRRIHFGFLVGFNMLDFHVDNTGLATEENLYTPLFADVLSLSMGINLGIVNDIRLCDFLNLRLLPGISFGQRELTYTVAPYIDTSTGLLTTEPPIMLEKVVMKSTFIDLPILLKYSAFRYRNVKPYLVTGTSFRFDLAKDKDCPVKTKTFDTYIDAGAGFDFYLPYFRLSVELRASFGLSNVFDPSASFEPEDEPYRQAIDQLQSRWYGLTFYFE